MPNLERLFRTTEEQCEPVDASVSGNVPDWLDGSLIRVGPGIFDINSNFSLNHWCDGYAVLYKFNIHQGQVQFNKRYLKSDAYERAKKAGKPCFTEFGTRAYPDPSKGFLARAISQLLPDITDNCSGNIIKLGCSYFAVSDTSNFRVIYPDDISTGEKVDMYKALGVHIVCSHTLQDQDGSSYAMATSLVTGLKYNLIRIPNNSKSTTHAVEDAKVLCSISSRWKTCVSYYHSFGLSENYVVFIEQPFIMNGMKLLSSQVKGKSMKDCLEWIPTEVNRFYVIEKSSGKVLPIKYKSKLPFFLFHHVNTYEENGELIVDVIGHDSPEIVDKMSLSNLRSFQFKVDHKSEPRRFILPLLDNIKGVEEGVNLVKKERCDCEAVRRGDTIEVTHQALSAPAFELPTLNKALLGRKYRYFYATGLYDTSQYQYSVVKVDVEGGEVKKWFAGEGQVPSEALFIPRPDSSCEDDGILLVCVTTSEVQPTDRLVLLDAATLEIISTAQVPVHLPTGLHGVFIRNT